MIPGTSFGKIKIKHKTINSFLKRNWCWTLNQNIILRKKKGITRSRPHNYRTFCSPDNLSYIYLLIHTNAVRFEYSSPSAPSRTSFHIGVQGMVTSDSVLRTMLTTPEDPCSVLRPWRLHTELKPERIPERPVWVRNFIVVTVMVTELLQSHKTRVNEISLIGPPLKKQSCHDANFVVTGGTGGCCYDNLWCHPWRHSWHNDDIRCSLALP